ncbi:MAG: hypothetical protein AB1791_10445 [Chloroflexota bacterium]
MVADELARFLHDRATRGEALSAEEQAQLEAWYALQDSTESQELDAVGHKGTLVTLQAQVEVALTQLLTVSRRIQQVASENEALRREVAVLRRQLAQRPSLQPV